MSENKDTLFVDLSKLKCPAFLDLKGKKYITHSKGEFAGKPWKILENFQSLQVASYKGEIRLYPMGNHDREEHIEDAILYKKRYPFPTEMLSAELGKFIPVTLDKITLSALHEGIKYKNLRAIRDRESKAENKTYLVLEPDTEWEKAAEDAISYAQFHTGEKAYLLFKGKVIRVLKEDELEDLSAKRNTSRVEFDKTLSRLPPSASGKGRF